MSLFLFAVLTLSFPVLGDDLPRLEGASNYLADDAAVHKSKGTWKRLGPEVQAYIREHSLTNDQQAQAAYQHFKSRALRLCGYEKGQILTPEYYCYYRNLNEAADLIRRDLGSFMEEHRKIPPRTQADKEKEKDDSEYQRNISACVELTVRHEVDDVYEKLSMSGRKRLENEQLHGRAFRKRILNYCENSYGSDRNNLQYCQEDCFAKVAEIIKSRVDMPLDPAYCTLLHEREVQSLATEKGQCSIEIPSWCSAKSCGLDHVGRLSCIEKLNNVCANGKRDRASRLRKVIEQVCEPWSNGSSEACCLASMSAQDVRRKMPNCFDPIHETFFKDPCVMTSSVHNGLGEVVETPKTQLWDCASKEKEFDACLFHESHHGLCCPKESKFDSSYISRMPWAHDCYSHGGKIIGRLDDTRDRRARCGVKSERHPGVFFPGYRWVCQSDDSETDYLGIPLHAILYSWPKGAWSKSSPRVEPRNPPVEQPSEGLETDPKIRSSQ